MYLEAVTVCVGYADFLAETVRVNRPHFDHLIVVTTPDDHETLDLCKANNLEAVVTRDFYRDNDPFNKGRAIERALAMISHRDWVLHLDADIALPVDFRDSLRDLHLHTDCIYGVDRILVRNWEQWQDMKRRGVLRRAWHCGVYTGGQHGLLIGDRWADIRFGYVPIGFFQLWHGSATHRDGVVMRRYPDCHSDAARADVKFALQWDRCHRILIPEILVAHLESEKSKLGANWKGRTTAPFGPSAPPKKG